MVRPAYVHPSGLSPAEDEAYSAWIVELEGQVSKLGRGLRFGEMLGFVRKRTPVEREPEVRLGHWLNECDIHVNVDVSACRLDRETGGKVQTDARIHQIMSYFGSMAQQQSLGVGEFVAILRLVGPFCAASMCVNSVANSTGYVSYTGGPCTQLAHARTCLTLCRDHIFIQASLPSNYCLFHSRLCH